MYIIQMQGKYVVTELHTCHPIGKNEPKTVPVFFSTVQSRRKQTKTEKSEF